MVLYPGTWVLALSLCYLTDAHGLSNYGTIDFSRYCGSGHFEEADHAGFIQYAPETASSARQSCMLRLNPPVGAIAFYLQFSNLTLDCSYQTLKVYERTKVYEPGTMLVDFCSENADEVTEITSSEKSIGIEFFSNPNKDNLEDNPAGFLIMYTVFSGSIEGLGLCPLEHIGPGFMQPQFKCANGRCIHAELECDGINNCGDSSDESNLDHETNCDRLKDPPGNRTDLPQASEVQRPNFPTTWSAPDQEEATHGGHGLSNGAIVAIVIIAFVSVGIIIFAAAVRYSRFRNKFQGGATQRSIDYEYTESPAYESSERVARLVIRDGRAIITRGYIPTHSVGGSTGGTEEQVTSSAHAMNGDCSNAANNPQANGHVVLPARSEKPSLQPLLGDRKGSDSDGALLPTYPPPPYADLYQVYDRTLDSSAV
ncbi:uncharacterized protein [Branchiostoma lanceolatum]|uniref:uncharacterized protein isoform X2 n=1 Tax=Branchiostoma lanceolatum TaxID=7740 RepID=UPI0034552E01